MIHGVLGCMNSMDNGAFIFTQSFWLDLVLWTLGAVFLNRVVLPNVRQPTVQGEPEWARRSFFLLVGACLVLLLALASAGAPLLGLSPERLARCQLNLSLLAVMVVGPALLFSVQALLFQGMGRRLFGDRQGRALVALLISSVLLVVVLSQAREVVVLPELCGSARGSAFFSENSGY